MLITFPLASLVSPIYRKGDPHILQ